MIYQLRALNDLIRNKYQVESGRLYEILCSASKILPADLAANYPISITNKEVEHAHIC